MLVNKVKIKMSVTWLKTELSVTELLCQNWAKSSNCHKLNMYIMLVTVLGVLHISLFSPPQNISIKFVTSILQTITWAQQGLIICWCQTPMSSLPRSIKQQLTLI